MTAGGARKAWSVRRLLTLVLVGGGVYGLLVAAVVDLVFLPRISALHDDTQQLIREFESLSAHEARLEASISGAQASLAAGALPRARVAVQEARSTTTGVLTSEARDAMSTAPTEMRSALASVVYANSDIRDVLGETIADIELGRISDAETSLARADSLAAELGSTLAGVQRAGLGDVATRGTVLETLAGQVARTLLALSVLGGLLIVGAVVLLRRRFYAPLEALDTGLRAASGGDLSTRVEVAREDEFGRLAGLFNRMVEALAEREAEREVEREEVTRRILHAALDAVITVDLQGLVTSWNPGAEGIFGWSREEAVGASLADLISPPDLKEHQRSRLLDVLAGQNEALGRRLEGAARRKGGEVFTAETSLVPLVENGETVGLAAFVRDVTEQRRAEQAVRRSEGLLRSVIDNSPAVVFVKDLEGRYTLVNRRYLDLWQVSSGDVLGKTDAEFLPRATYEDIRPRYEKVLASGRPEQFEERVDLPGGPRDFVAVRFPLADVNGEIYGVCTISTDVTELLQLQDQVRRTQRLEAVGRLAGGIAHDFNNLISVILGHAQLTMDEAESPEIRQALEEIERAAQRAAALTSQLLGFARRQIVVPRVADINVLTREILDMVIPMLGDSVLVTSALDPDAGSVNIDPAQLSQALLSLLVNAGDALGENGGSVEVTTTRVVVDKKTSFDLTAGEYVVVKVTDDGPGIPDEVMDRIFEPFVTTRDDGHGLGLATCHGIIKQAQGAVTAKNREEGGAEVAVYLPCVSPPTS